MRKRRRVWRKHAVIAGIGVGIVLLGSACLYGFVRRETGPIPYKYTQGLNFTLYYPSRLPNGYTVNPRSFERKENALIFSIEGPEHRNVAVSLQATPGDLPARGSHPTPIAIPGERTFYTAIGPATIGFWGKKYVSDIITPKGTWIIMNVSGFTADEATKLGQSFTEL